MSPGQQLSLLQTLMQCVDEEWFQTTTGCPNNTAIPQCAWTPITRQDTLRNSRPQDAVDEDEHQHSARLNTNRAQKILLRVMDNSPARRLPKQLTTQ